MTTPPEPIQPPTVRWFPILTPRLTLREFRPDDLDDIHAYGRDPEVVRYMHWGPNTPLMTRAFLDERLAGQQTWPRLSVDLAVEIAVERRVIGAVRLGIGDQVNRTGEIGYTLHRGYWARGLASEAARVLVQAGFERLGLHRIWATCDVRNIGSQRVLEKLGMRREGELRDHIWAHGGWRTTLLYAMLAEEWAAAEGSAAAVRLPV